MLPTHEVFTILGISVLVLDLIVTGVIGLIRGEIQAKNIFVQLFFLPLGVIGKIVGYCFAKSNNDVESGIAAISSSIATIATGVLLAFFFGFYYLNTYEILSDVVIETLVPVSLIALILCIPLTIVVVRGIRKRT